MEEINHMSVFYGDGEYTSHIANQDLAAQYATTPSAKRFWPLLVQTIEHGGWSMTHYFDDTFPKGICVGTANDRAKFHPLQEQIRERIYNMRRKSVGDVRRPRRTVAA